MENLSLRFRVFLFFCLVAFGGIAGVIVALWMGYRQLGDPSVISPLVTVGVVAAFGILALSTFVWRLFDEHVSKPIESLAAHFRVLANSGASSGIDASTARYLGDLAPAVLEINKKLDAAEQSVAETVAERTERLERQRSQFLRILSDLPVAVILCTQDHQIALYDGQAADLMEREAPARLNASVFDYLDETSIREALAALDDSEASRRPITLKGPSGAAYSGHVRQFEGGNGYTLMLEPLDPNASRPLVYDLDLLDKSRSDDLDATALRDLTFVVFDSETTGLDPSKDHVVQIGAIRVVNGKIVRSETFETLVDPGQPIPPGSTKVHGIDDAMVSGAPSFPEARAAFHGFCRETVLLAHNAPFDMAFLLRDTTAAEVFDHPVLDTVHLSAIVFGGSAEHTLDAICDRLRITIPQELRHTALGDAIATAEVFVALIPILEARGLTTFGAVRAEMKKHNRILKMHEAPRA